MLFAKFLESRWEQGSKCTCSSQDTETAFAAAHTGSGSDSTENWDLYMLRVSACIQVQPLEGGRWRSRQAV